MSTQDTHGQSGSGWYGFDLDGTLAKYDGWKGIEHIGEPVKPMVDLIKRMHAEGKVVKILTARVAPRANVETRPNPYLTDLAVHGSVGHNNAKTYRDIYESPNWTAREFIIDWCLKNLGFLPEITHEKDHLMLELYDDRVKQVIPNEGVLVEALADRAVAEYDRVKAEYDRVKSDLGWALNRANCKFISFMSGVLIASVVYSLAHLGLSWRESFADRTPAREALRAARDSLSVLSERLDDLERGRERDWGFVPSDVLSIRDGCSSVGGKD